ncbi:hypothetical protein LJC14_07825, partial [Treponema sp. OttesenSCG-928-L16]|nr:hypothetical protein [Treponema sp. OttesenSCG-928-L16]
GELGVVTNPFAAIAPGHNLGMYSLQSAGLSLDWALERFYPEERNRLGGGIFSLLRKELAGIPPGAGGLVCAPWLHGEQQPVPPSARLAFLGARPEHSRVHFIAAVLEGIAYTLRWRLEAYRSIGEIPLRIRAVGGGAENPIWMQMMADILQAEIQVTENPRHAGTVGAASFAWIGMGVYRNLSEAAGKIAVREHYYPRREYMSRYDILYEALKTAAPALDCFSRELSRFDNLSV